jgi:hypothetical protein
MELTQYNLKRISNCSNPERLTFVCSCVCRKNNKCSLSKCLTSISNEDSGERVMKKNVKRSNDEACGFRISFKKLQDGTYNFIDKYNFHHNHKPNLSKVRVYFYIRILGIFLETLKYL